MTSIYIQHVEGSKRGQIEAFDKERIRIGRQPDNDLRFDPVRDREVSGYHAEIYCEGETFFIKDLQSTNGTFINSHRIAEPFALAEGQVIQFSSRAPQIIFFTKHPAAKSPAPGEATVAVREAEVVAPPTPAKAGDRMRWILIAGAGVGIVALLGLGHYLSLSWWAYFILPSAFLAALFSGLLVWRWWKGRHEAAKPAPRAVEENRLQAGEGRGYRPGVDKLRHKWAEGLQTLRGSKLKQQGEDPIYAFPWFVVLGEPGSGKTAAILASRPHTSSSASKSQGLSATENCDWWLFDSAVILDTAGRYAFPTIEEIDEAEWKEFLSLLKSARWREPVNGVIVVVAADSLASRSTEKLREDASRLRRRLDEMGRNLGTSFPIYLLISKSDSMPGFTEFFWSLPERVRGQAMGAVNGDIDNPAGATAFLDQGCRLISERLDLLRLTLIEEEENPTRVRNLFVFPEELRALRTPLRTYVDALFRQTPYQETPFFRGFFFTSVRQEGVPLSKLLQRQGLPGWPAEPARDRGPFFAHDILAAVLPQERSMVRRTVLWRQRYHLSQAAVLVATAALSLLLSGLLTLSFTRNWQALSRLDVNACLEQPVASARVVAQRLEELNGCREAIAGLRPQSFWKRVAQSFGLSQSRRLEKPLRQRYLVSFQANVLDPLDTRIDQKLGVGPEAPAQVAALLQRTNLLTRCQRNGGCRAIEAAMRPNYLVMLRAESPAFRDRDPVVEQMHRTYEAYLRWQPDPQGYEKMRAKHLQRVRRWLSSGGLKPEWIIASASDHFPAVRNQDFWGTGPASQVDAAYTQRAWSEGIQPLLSGLQEVAPEIAEIGEAVKRFELGYRIEGLRQWERFLAQFPQGEKAASQRTRGRELAVNTLGPDSPYARLIEVASANVDSLLSAARNEGDVPAWAATLKRFVALKSKAEEAKKLKQDPGALKAKLRDEEREALGYLSGYLEALEQLRAELVTPDKSFKSAQKAFEEEQLGGRSDHPTLKAHSNLQRLRSTIGSPFGEERIFWNLLSRPVELAWRVTLDQSGVYLQQQWEALWLDIAELPASQKGGRVMGFVNGPAATFLERRGDRYIIKKLFEENLSFTGSFLDYIYRVRAFLPDSSARLDPPRQIVRMP